VPADTRKLYYRLQNRTPFHPLRVGNAGDDSVDQDRVGAASGINNAVARVAGVLAIALLGIVMVKAFGARLNHSLACFSLSPAILHDLQTNEIKLAGLQVPAELNPATKIAVKKSIGEAFVFGFRIVMLICAALSLASAAVAGLMIPKKRVGPQERNVGAVGDDAVGA
jgi:hypothetical protein